MPGNPRRVDHAALVETAYATRSLTRAAELFGVSRERVRQICQREGVDVAAVARAETAERREREADERVEAARARKMIPIQRLHALAQSLGYMPTTTEIIHTNGSLYTALTRLGSIADIVREASETLGLPIRWSEYKNGGSARFYANTTAEQRKAWYGRRGSRKATP